MSNAEYNPGEGRQYFERPETFLNRSLRWLADRRSHAELPLQDIEWLRDNSVKLFSGIVVDHEALEKVRTETSWYMADESCPSMVLGGEVTVDDEGQTPEVRFFADAPVLTVRGLSKRMANLLSAADHFTGHLYAYYTGASDYDEPAAVYWQNRAAVARAEAGDIRFRHRPLVNMLVYKKHKQITHGAYSPRSLPFIKAMLAGMPRVEQCVLRYPEVEGWIRTSTDSPVTGIITSYSRQLGFPGAGQHSLTAQQLDSGGEVLWEINVANTEKGRALFMTKKGRPRASDIKIVADFERHLQQNGVTKTTVELPKGGFPEVMGL